MLRQASIAIEPAALGVSVPGRRVFDRDGNVVAERSLKQVLTSWGPLYGLLRDTLPASTIITANLESGSRRVATSWPPISPTARGLRRIWSLARTASSPRCDGNFCRSRGRTMPAMSPGAA
jgi:hypothetical protein